MDQSPFQTRLLAEGHTQLRSQKEEEENSKAQGLFKLHSKTLSQKEEKKKT